MMIELKMFDNCKCCSVYDGSLFQTTHNLYKKIGSGENAPYVKIEMQTGGNKHSNILFESASENKVNRATLEIDYCPMCGRKL